MGTTNIIVFLIVGALSGWIASKLMKGGSSGLFTNIILGIIGGIVGGWLFDFLDISTGGGLTGSLITSVVGAMVVIFLANMFSKK